MKLVPRPHISTVLPAFSPQVFFFETSFGESTGTLDPGPLAYNYTCLHLYLLTSILETSFGEATGTLDPGTLSSSTI